MDLRRIGGDRRVGATCGEAGGVITAGSDVGVRSDGSGVGSNDIGSSITSVPSSRFKRGAPEETVTTFRIAETAGVTGVV